MKGSILMVFCVSAVALRAAATDDSGPRLVSGPDGGWRTAGLPYTAHISAQGCLDSLKVGDFDFIAAGGKYPSGIYLADGNIAIPFSSAAASGDTLKADSERGSLTIRFLPAGLELTVMNRSITNDRHCLWMDVTRDIARIKALGRAIEYDTPLKTSINSDVRLIGKNRSSVSFGEPRSYQLSASGQMIPENNRYLLKFPGVRIDSISTFSMPIATAPRLEDGVTIKVKCDKEDLTFWSDDPRELTTVLTNPYVTESFRASVILRLRSYLTREVVKEMRRRVSLGGRETKELTWTLADLEPMLYIAEVWAESGKYKALCCAPRFVFNASELLPPKMPEDFDRFWKRTLEEQAKIPLDLKIEKVKEQGAHEVHKFSFAGLLGYRCYGWLTLPKNKSRKWPAVLVLPPAGMRSQPIPIFPNAVGMRININTVDVDLPEHKYDWRTWPAPYLVTGILDRDYYCLRFGYAAIVRAAEVLAARPEVDKARIRVTGSSQGGGLVFIAAGLYPGFESAKAIKPGLCRLDWNLDYLQPPFFPIAVDAYSRPEITRTLKYFLPSHFARRIECPIAVSLGLYDDVTPAVGVFCAYNAIPGDKKTIEIDPHAGH